MQLWHVYGFAFLLGCVTAFDTPARQTFVSELVGEKDLANAVALNSTSFNIARMLGPAVAGVLIAAIGTGWLFLINAASFVAVIGSLLCLRVGELHRKGPGGRAKGGFADGFRYVWRRADLKAVLLMLFLIGTFALNFLDLHLDHVGHGLSCRRRRVRLVDVLPGGGLGRGRAAGGAPRRAQRRAAARRGDAAGPRILAAAALAPSYAAFGFALVVVGAAAQTFTTSTNSLVQMSTEPAMRGRVIAILFAIAMGGTPIGAPIVGAIADRFGPRWALAAGAISALVAAAVALRYLATRRNLRLNFAAGWPFWRLDDAETGVRQAAAPPIVYILTFAVETIKLSLDEIGNVSTGKRSWPQARSLRMSMVPLRGCCCVCSKCARSGSITPASRRARCGPRRRRATAIPCSCCLGWRRATRARSSCGASSDRAALPRGAGGRGSTSACARA